MSKNLCYKCRIKNGCKPKDDYAHTAKRHTCGECGVVEAIIGDRHWIKGDKDGN